MGTVEIQEGDEVCILFGGAVPYVLRSTGDADDSWTFIGDAYVDGIMDVGSQPLLFSNHYSSQLTIHIQGRTYTKASRRRKTGVGKAVVQSSLNIGHNSRGLDQGKIGQEFIP